MSDTTRTPARTGTGTYTVGQGQDTLHYDVHGDLTAATADRPVLLMVGSPMDASGFTSLAARFSDRPVVTVDPRGAGRNPKGTSALSPEVHARDLHRVVEDLGVGPLDVFASSGAAINALVLAAAHPEDLRRLIAHEPPSADPLPDRQAYLAVCRDIKATYQASGSGPAMAKFITYVMQQGPTPPDYLERPAPEPAQFGLPTRDDGERSDPLMRNIPACQAYRFDYEALAALGDRVVLAYGVESGEEGPARGARAVAERIGRAAVGFPSHHAGFLGGEFGQHGDPEAFAERLRLVLA
ncbi:alpha/beta fold hydrolase [Kineococcus indalonis]|uniref:alpha/beta fold hydrolase n=1 Tax=Kineococcus indalonis TaxID=2696566 RepID=UPI001412FA37|nr:alpha/beta hydrolase [Kineococcus indalonis]NAZ84656.1 alpha/beta fold hydrolase [Kineococcus indalonis]